MSRPAAVAELAGVLPGREAALLGEPGHLRPVTERDFFIDNLLVQIHYIILMIRWTGLAPREFEFPLPGSFLSTFLVLYSLRCYRTEVSWLPEKSSLPSGENATEFSNCGRA